MLAEINSIRRLLEIPLAHGRPMVYQPTLIIELPERGAVDQ